MRSEFRPEGPSRILLVAGSAALLGSLDSALNIAFPDVTSHFELDVAAIQWLVITYVLTYAALLLVAGRIADRLGHQQMLIRGLGVSTVAFVATGLAPSYGFLLAARMVQGAGAAMILAAAPALVTLATSEERRGRALGLFQMSAAIGLAIGPLVGGALVFGFGWRAVFLFRVPLAVVIIVLARPLPTPQRVLHNNEARKPGTGAVSHLLRHPPFVLANVLNLVSNATMFAIWLLMPYYAINVIDIGAVRGGAVLMIAPLATALSAPPAGWLADRFGSATLSTAGLALEAFALGLLSRLDSGSSVGLAALGLTLVGVSISVFAVPNMRYVMGSIGEEHQGVAGSIVQTMRTAGIVIGVFAASAWFESRRSETAERLGVDVDGPISFVPAFRSTLTAATALTVAALLLSVVRGRSRPVGLRTMTSQVVDQSAFDPDDRR